MNTFEPVVNAPILYVQGFQFEISKDTPQLGITPGQCRDHTNTNDISVTADFTIMDLSFHGFNGLDSGSLQPNKVYAIYAIGDESNLNPSGFIASLNQDNNPYMPFGYNLIRRLAWISTDGSGNFYPVYISGNGSVRSYEFPEAVSILSAGTDTSFTEINLSTLVPVSYSPVILQANFSNSGWTNTNPGNLMHLNTGQIGGPGIGNISITSNLAASNFYQLQILSGINNNGDASIYYRVETSVDGTPSLDLALQGFVDYL